MYRFKGIIPKIKSAEVKWLNEALESKEEHFEKFEDYPDAYEKEVLKLKEEEPWREHEDHMAVGSVAFTGYRVEGAGYYLLEADEGTPQKVAELMRVFLKRFRPRDVWSMTFAATGFEPDGGAVVVTSEDIKVIYGSSLVRRLKKRFEKTGSIKGSAR